MVDFQDYIYSFSILLSALASVHITVAQFFAVLPERRQCSPQRFAIRISITSMLTELTNRRRGTLMIFLLYCVKAICGKP